VWNIHQRNAQGVTAEAYAVCGQHGAGIQGIEKMEENQSGEWDGAIENTIQNAKSWSRWTSYVKPQGGMGVTHQGSAATNQYMICGGADVSRSYDQARTRGSCICGPKTSALTS